MLKIHFKTFTKIHHSQWFIDIGYVNLATKNRGSTWKNDTRNTGFEEQSIIFQYQGRIQDFKLGGRTYKNCPEQREARNFWGISCEKSRFYAKKNHIFSNFRAAPPWIRPWIRYDMSNQRLQKLVFLLRQQARSIREKEQSQISVFPFNFICITRGRFDLGPIWLGPIWLGTIWPGADLTWGRFDLLPIEVRFMNLRRHK